MWFVVRSFVNLCVVSCLLFVVCRLRFCAKRLLFEALCLLCRFGVCSLLVDCCWSLHVSLLFVC